LHWVDEKKHQKILHEKRDMPGKGKGWEKMNPVYLSFREFLKKL